MRQGQGRVGLTLQDAVVEQEMRAAGAMGKRDLALFRCVNDDVLLCRWGNDNTGWSFYLNGCFPF